MNVGIKKIIINECITQNIYKLSVEFSDKIKPGQFFMLKTLNDEFLLPRPISVYDSEEGSVSFLYRVGGKGTNIISKLDKNDEIQILGPLGNGFDTKYLLNKKVAIVGGGIGIAPLMYLTKKLNKKADVYLGFKDFVYCVDEFEKNCANLWTTTEDGSVGEKGFVTEIIDYSKYDVIVTCGPQIMMDRLMNECENHNIECIVSLEKRMACGIGVCLGCSIETKNGMKRVCKDGPVFNSSELVR